MEIQACNVNEALAKALEYIFTKGTLETSRNGPVLVAPEPVMTTYARPTQRVLFSPTRDANPFFHLMEALWMLAGKNDLAWPVQFNSRFKEYSDNGATLAGAYGFRWRHYFGRDQLKLIVDELRLFPESRRAVLEMWSQNDLGGTGRDLPCNTHAYFDLRNGALNMTVCNRSNDALWGAYGANAVHFSILQEYLAASLSAPVGIYRQFSNNLHIYTDILPPGKAKLICAESKQDTPYTDGACPSPLVSVDIKDWDIDLQRFLKAPNSIPHTFRDPFFTKVACPMLMAWQSRKNPNYWPRFIDSIAAPDWQRACHEWLLRRAK